MKTYIVGHKNPDTDSVVSAIALSELEKAEGKDYIAVRAGDLNKETEFVLNQFAFKMPELLPEGEKKVILVDHNEVSQISENISTDQIQCIIDHHKLGGLSLSEPISVRTKPVVSTATMIAQIFNEDNIEITKNVAGILLAGIISDTLNLTSPTTTEKDKKIVEALNKIANIDIERLAKDMFAAKSDISDIPTEELLNKDYKNFEIVGKKIGFGVWETVLPEAVLEREQEIINILDKMKQEESLDFVFFAVVDILNNNSVFIIISDTEKEVAEAAFGGKVENGLMKLEGVVSRKKQMIPPLEKYFSIN
jgi:manganese-dependent inorganic pyrophosphatase